MKEGGRRQKAAFWIALTLVAGGIILLVYPFFRDMVSDREHEKAIAQYEEVWTAPEKEEESRDRFKMAVWYNTRLSKNLGQMHFVTGEPKDQDYAGLMCSENGVMGTLIIDSIGVRLPIYPGTGDDSLSMGVGHLEGTSLPVGGGTTHCVLSGHSGMADALILSRLPEVETGDEICLRVLNRTLVYEVYDTETVPASDASSLVLREGEDLLTVFTCVPLGINSHRFMVHAKRRD